MSRPILSSRWARRLGAALVTLAAASGAVLIVTRSKTKAPRLDHDVAAPLDSASSMVSRLLADAANSATASAEAALAAGYLERHRLGLSGPFRLADFAMADPALSATVQRGVAWLLLRQAYFGQGYELDPAVFRDVDGDTLSAAKRAAHVRLVERIVEEAADPRGGELTVRLAYQLAETERTIIPAVTRQAIKLAALTRDRALARRDARALVDAASAARADPLTLVPSWRASLRFAVERPVWDRSAWERRAAADAPDYLRMIRTIAIAASGDSMAVEDEGERARRRGLAPTAAARLLALTSEGRLAPQAAVVLATREHARRGTTRMQAANEEALAAELSLRDADHDASTALDAAIGLRALAQERSWFPGNPGPTERDLRRRFGYASITFERGVPALWRPYYLHTLASATADLQRALPPLTVAGSHIRFAAASPNDTLLAMHVAQTRTVVIPIATGAGTLAHEIAHDVDARAGRLRYGRGGYATDLAVRRQDGRLAASIAGLTRTRLVVPGNGRASPHRQRPAEVFARALEWVVPAALARDGRSNGFLSSVQDELFTGSGSVTAADVSLGAMPVLSELLDEMASDDARAAAAGIRARFEGVSEWTASRVLRVVMETPLPDVRATRVGNGWTFLDPAGSLEASLPASALPCVGDEDERAWRDDLLRVAVDARLRGIARSRARRNVMNAAPVARFLGLAGPWNDSTAETYVERARDALLVRIYERISGPPALSETLAGGATPAVCARR